MSAKIKKALSSLLANIRDALAARDAALHLLTDLGFAGGRTGPTYHSPANFLRDFPIALRWRERIEPALRGAFSHISILLQWTAEDLALNRKNVTGGGSILFLLAPIRRGQDIGVKQCETWAKQIRHAFGARTDMSIAIMFVRQGSMIFTFTHYDGRGWQATACPAVSGAENIEFLESLSPNAPNGGSRLNSIDSVRRFWIEALQIEFEERKVRDIRACNIRLYSVLREVLDHGLTHLGQLSNAADILLEVGLILRELSSHGLEYPKQLSQVSDIMMNTDLIWRGVPDGEIDRQLFKNAEALMDSVDAYGSAGLDRIIAAMSRVLNRQGILTPIFPNLLWEYPQELPRPPHDVDKFLDLVREEMLDENWTFSF